MSKRIVFSKMRIVLAHLLLFPSLPPLFADCISETPKAFANFSPGLLQPWEHNNLEKNNAVSVGESVPIILANAFSVSLSFYFLSPPQG
jgi:hypothetical protein